MVIPLSKPMVETASSGAWEARVTLVQAAMASVNSAATCGQSIQENKEPRATLAAAAAVAAAAVVAAAAA